ncbi:MAG: LacI family DNA-binding transcriptional regulator [Erysipelotrichaceae bacterium]|nr:LacI family DNA-binding transcriptional regulator [Erysipelotrichaceae bacterium]
MPTIDDVARVAGVSKGTVSKVLKNYPNISEATRDNVMRVVKELGYMPNVMASHLSSKSSRRVALYVYINDAVQAIDEINMRYLFGAFQMAKELSLELVTCFNDSINHLSNEEFHAYFRSIGTDIIIVFGLNKDDEKMHYLLNHSNFKFVLVDAPIYDDKKSCVYIDHEKGQYDVAKTIVVPQDHVLYLAGKKNGYVTDQRLLGMQRLQKDVGFEMDVVFAEFSEKYAFDVVMDRGELYDAIVCASDLMAIGCLKALKRKGVYRKLVGFDGITLMAYAAQNVVTCKQDFTLLGKHAVAEANRLLQDEKGREVIVPYYIGNIDYRDIIS